MRREFPQMLKDAVVAEYTAGGSATKIAKKYGVDRSAPRQWAMAAGVIDKRRKPKKPPAFRQGAAMICHYMCDAPIPRGRHNCVIRTCRSMATRVTVILVVGYGVRSFFLCDGCCSFTRETVEGFSPSPRGIRAVPITADDEDQNDYYPVPGARMVLP